MKALSWLVLGILPLHAATISSGSTAALLHTGDALVFDLFTRNFSLNAAHFGLPVSPTDVSFTFVTTPVPEGAAFSAFLATLDGSISLAFPGPLDPATGISSGSLYSGPVSVISGYLHLSTELSTDLFAAGAADLFLRNDGPDLVLGLPPYTLRQDLSLSLAGGPLSVSALPFSANLQESAAPEPATPLLPLLPLALVLRSRRMSVRLPR